MVKISCALTSLTPKSRRIMLKKALCLISDALHHGQVTYAYRLRFQLNPTFPLLDILGSERCQRLLEQLA